MKHKGLVRILTQTEQFNSLLKTFEKGKCEQLIHGVSASQKALWAAATYEKTKEPIVFVTSDLRETKKVVSDFSVFFSPEEIDHLPQREILPYGIYARSHEIQVQRLKVIQKLVNNELKVLVIPAETLIQSMVPFEFLVNAQFSLTVNNIADYETILEKLTKLGYERVDLVGAPAQFSARGGIIDIFNPIDENPIRIEFFDDEIESIRYFDPESQRSIESLETATIYPARETLFGEKEKERAIKKLKEQLEIIKKENVSPESINKLEEICFSFVNNLEQNIWTEDMDNLYPFLFEKQYSIFDYFKKPPTVFLSESIRVFDSIHSYWISGLEKFSDWLEVGKAFPGMDQVYLNEEDVLKNIRKNNVVHLMSLPRKIPGANIKNNISFDSKLLPIMNRVDYLDSELKNWKKNKYVIIFLTSSEDRAERLKDNLIDRKIDTTFAESLEGPLLSGGVYIGIGNLQKGFEVPSLKFVIITDEELFGGQKQSRTIKKKREGSQIKTFVDLKEGDYVVHEQHGIGQYLGIKRLDAGGIQKDYLYIKYAGQDKLYLPAEQIDLLQKYIGSEGHAPKLSKLGGNEWARVKKRVKGSVQEIAKELLNLYAYREMLEGYAFSGYSEFYRQFEDAFLYTETPDQKKAIEEVISDMTKKRPMDRLVCGDVGYGKTEVAMRAAFKAAEDSKQVAVLVPTTVLAQQHYKTFTERFKDFPIRIGILSRFSTKKEIAKTLDELKTGFLDIVIGTHRLLSKDVKFKDLGLLIIDEEQRFGVKHKEKIKNLKKNIDVLTLSATPIPRTLHMALAGVRDMSIIETPPENRYPVQTYVVERSPQIIKDAIVKEMDRNGQIYFIHNRIEDMDKVQRELQLLVPEAKIAVAHGQMRETELEKVMLDFMEGNFDILLCTTIIENGLDISNVNTIIVDDADKMGLSQLYQIRGRVGRTNRVAYAYFMYSKDKVLTEVAEKRLAAIREFTEFGSGFKIAMRDLEIRGAGNILGPEQHGQMLSVGFELYCKLLEEEVNRLKGKEIKEEKEEKVTVELNIDAYIKDTYVEDSGLKMEIYRYLAAVDDLEKLKQVEEELKDRFGNPPEEVQNLISITGIKIIAEEQKVQFIKQEGTEILIKYPSTMNIKGNDLLELAKKYKRRLSFSVSDGLTVKINIKELNSKEILDIVESVLNNLKEILENNVELKN